MAVQVVNRNSGRAFPERKTRKPKPNRSPQPVQKSQASPKGPVRILKRGEEISKPPQNQSPQVPVLGSTNRLVLDPKQVPILPTPVPLLSKPNRKQTKPADALASAGFYAGSASCITSPPPSSLPLPSFFAKKAAATTSSTDEAASVLLKLLRLNLS